MKKIKTKVLASIVLLACSLTAHAQSGQASQFAMGSDNPFAEREGLLKKYPISNALRMGWYTGVVDSFEIRDLLSRFLPLSNYLSNQLQSLVVLETDKSDRAIASDAVNGNLELVYTSALMGSELVKKGWKPVVGRTDDIRSVVLGLENTKINTPQDLKGKKIMAALGATVTFYAQYSLLVDKVLNSANGDTENFLVKKVNQNQLLDVLKTKQVDGIVVRDTLANRLIKENPGIYKVIYTAKSSPGHMLFAHPLMDTEKIETLRQSFLELNPNNKAFKKILSGLDGYSEKETQPFKVVTEANLDVSKEVFTSLGEPPLK